MIQTRMRIQHQSGRSDEMILWDSKTAIMVLKRAVHKIVIPVLVGILFLSIAKLSISHPLSAASLSHRERVSISFAGGIAHAMDWNMLSDLRAGLQLAIFTHTSLGVGFGYIGDSNHMGRGGHAGGMMGGFSGHNHHLQVFPVTLSLYYRLPVNPKVNVFMVGGGGYYLGSFRDVSMQWEGVFGPHAGLGVDFNLADNIGLVAEGVYRFGTFDHFSSEIHSEVYGDEGVEGYNHHHDHDEALHYHEYGSDDVHGGMGAVPMDMSLNGFSLRLGIQFHLK